MAEADLVPMPERPPPLPESVDVDPNSMDIRLAPNELRLLKAETGKTMAELLGEDAEDADRFQVTIWLKLRRLGHRPSYADCGDIAVAFVAEPPDPTSGES
jgi:hypothetical protein